MNDRLVTTCIHILNVLSAQGTHVNNIISQTSLGPKGSPDRTHAEEAIRMLEKGKIASHKGKWSPGKRKIMTLTPLGHEIKDLLNEIILYRESYKKFEEEMKLAKSKNNLENPSYSQKSPKMLINLQNGRMFVESVFKKNMILALAHRYSYIYYNYELNKISDAILVTIISNEFTYQLLEKEDPTSAKLKKKYFLPEVLLDIFMEPVIRDIQNIYSSDFYISSWRYGKQELKDVLSRILSVARISDSLITKAMTLAKYNDMEKIKTLYNKKSGGRNREDYIEYVSSVFQSFNPRGYENLPNAEVYRQKDIEELISIYRNLSKYSF